MLFPSIFSTSGGFPSIRVSPHGTPRHLKPNSRSRAEFPRPARGPIAISGAGIAFRAGSSWGNGGAYSLGNRGFEGFERAEGAPGSGGGREHALPRSVAPFGPARERSDAAPQPEPHGAVRSRNFAVCAPGALCGPQRSVILWPSRRAVGPHREKSATRDVGSLRRSL